MQSLTEDREKVLIKRLRKGENGAMRDFYSLYADYLSGICARYIDDEEDLKDVFQDCFVNIMTNIERFEYRGDGSLMAWAKKVAVNQSLRFLKERKRSDLVLLDHDVPEEKETEDPSIHNVPAEVLHQLIRELPAGYRTVFNLYVFEDKSHHEIADILGIKKDSSASQLHRAKNLLAQKIKQYHSSK